MISKLHHKAFFAAVICAGCLLVPKVSTAADKFAAEVLKIGLGARAMGMGGAFTALSNDASGAYWNPAGLNHIGSREAMLQHASQFGGTFSNNFGSIVLPIEGSPATIALTGIYQSYGDITVTTDAKIGEDQDGNPILDPSKFRFESAYDLGLLLSYARPLGEQWSTGVNVKLLRSSLAGEGSSFGIGADLGFQYLPSDKVQFGVRLADITTTRLFWDSGKNETVSPTVTIGAAGTQPISALHGALTLALDFGLAFEDLDEQAAQFKTGSTTGTIMAGAEYWYRETVALRLGSDQSNLTAGAGVRYKSLGVDYAYLDHEDLDATHRVSALFRF